MALDQHQPRSLHIKLHFRPARRPKRASRPAERPGSSAIRWCQPDDQIVRSWAGDNPHAR